MNLDDVIEGAIYWYFTGWKRIKGMGQFLLIAGAAFLVAAWGGHTAFQIGSMQAYLSSTL